jgi:serine/threonine protein kinase
LKEIGESALRGSGLKSVQIPKSVEKICFRCFYECKSLCEVSFEGKSEIGLNFGDCPLSVLRVPVGMNLSRCDVPRDCRIEYFEPPAVEISDHAAGKSGCISDWIFDLSEYEPVEQVGGRGQVCLWRHRGESEEIAVKSFRFGSDSVKNEGIQRTFIREVESLMKLNEHPCIVSLKGCCLPCGNEGPKIVTEFLGNGSLKSILGSKPPRWWTYGRKVKSIAGIVLGMKFIHSKGLIHRDLKPENILFDDDLRIRIADFGSSRIFEVDVTLTGGGTPLYMAPEVPTHHYNEKVDVYSFGLVLYEIIVGDGLFSGPGDKMKLFLDLQKGWRPIIPDKTESVSRKLIESCWSENPGNRPSFDEIWISMEKCNFRLLPGVKKSDIEGFLNWFYENGGEK